MESLSRAIDLHAENRELAWTDKDLAYVPDHPEYGPRFWEIVGKGVEGEGDEPESPKEENP